MWNSTSRVVALSMRAMSTVTGQSPSQLKKLVHCWSSAQSTVYSSQCCDWSLTCCGSQRLKLFCAPATCLVYSQSHDLSTEWQHQIKEIWGVHGITHLWKWLQSCRGRPVSQATGRNSTTLPCIAISSWSSPICCLLVKSLYDESGIAMTTQRLPLDNSKARSQERHHWSTNNKRSCRVTLFHNVDWCTQC